MTTIGESKNTTLTLENEHGTYSVPETKMTFPGQGFVHANSR